MRDRPSIPDRLLIAAAAAPAVALFAPLLVPLATGRVFAADDLSAFHLPMRFLYASALQEGESILWTPYLFGGFYLHAEGQVGALHPLHLLLYQFLPLNIAFNLEFIASYVAAFAGMWFFLRRIGLHTAASIAGAMAFAFSGFVLLHFIHMNAVAIAAHIPWLLAAMHMMLRGPGRTRAPAFAALPLLVASQILLGYPQYVWMSALICALYGLVPPIRSVPLLLGAAGAACLGLVVGAAQLLPTLDLVDDSVRATVSREFALSFSLHPLNILQLWSPYVFPRRAYYMPGEHFVHEFGVYNGAFCTLAIFYVAARRRELAFRNLAVFGIALCVLGVVLALGGYTPIYPQLARAPFLSSFRAAARHILLLHVGLSILAAIAFDDVLRLLRAGPPSFRRITWLAAPAAVSGIIAICAWVFPGLFGADSSTSIVGKSLVGVALAGFSTWLVSAAVRGDRTAILVLPLAIAVDLGLWGYSYVWSSSPRAVSTITADLQLPGDLDPDTQVHLTEPDARRNYVLLVGLKLFEPYVGLSPRRALSPEDGNALRVAGVSWVRHGGRWREVDRPMPRARLVFDARASADPSKDLPAIDVATTALVPPGAPELKGSGKGRALVVLDQPGSLTIDVTAATPSWLVTTESFHSGWTAAVGEKSLIPAAVYGDHLGLPLDAGTYRVEFNFRPQSARWGLWTTLAGLILTAASAAGLAFINRTKDSVEAA